MRLIMGRKYGEPGVKVKRSVNGDGVEISVLRVGDSRNEWVKEPFGMSPEQAKEFAEEIYELAEEIGSGD